MVGGCDDIPARPVEAGREDRFSFEIGEACVGCGACARACPARAIVRDGVAFRVDAVRCIDCGTCSAACPTGAARPVPGVRESLDLAALPSAGLRFNPGCALALYKPDVPARLLSLLRRHVGDVSLHDSCCRHDPGLPAGSVIINACAGCDRRFRSLYAGVRTISLWEVLDSVAQLGLPDHSGLTVSVHDSCGYRHKPQVHAAVRGLLARMGVRVVDSPHSGTRSVCCGDSLYGIVPNGLVEARMRRRAAQLPCDDVVVYCIGCVRAMEEAGKRVHYLPDLLLGRETEPMPDTLDEYHARLEGHVARH